jgi:magnesium chelatase subunit D
VQAAPDFRLIAAMNPFDAIGTARVSQAIADRICRIVLGYQDAAAERGITTAVTGHNGQVVGFAVALTRSTRTHRDVRMGASVRGAIDLVLLIDGLRKLRGEDAMSRPTAQDAAFAALSGRIRIADGCDRSPESVLQELLADLWPAGAAQPPDPGEDSDDAAPPDGQGKADGPSPPAPGLRSASQSSLRRERRQGPSRRTVGRAELASRHSSFGDVSPETGELDARALEQLLGTDPDAAAALLADLSQATDEELRKVARRLAARVFIQLGAAGRQSARGPRRIRSVLRGDGDIDLDRTLDRLSGAWPPPGEDLVTRSWQAHRRSVCLLVDSSGSMSGLALAMAAVATASVLLAADGRLDTGALAFSGQVTVLQPPGARQQPDAIVGRLLGLRGHGVTDVAGALRSAAGLLAPGGPAERCAVLLSDCLSTAGGDPATALAGIDRLDVLCPLPAGTDPDPASLAAAGRLARLGGGIMVPVRTLTEVPAALTRLLSGR